PLACAPHPPAVPVPPFPYTTLFRSHMGMRLTEPTNGRVWHTTERPGTTEESVGGLVDFNTAAVVVGTAIPGFFSGLVVFQLLIRSEEHTSELPSRFDLVCRLLLEKK